MSGICDACDKTRHDLVEVNCAPVAGAMICRDCQTKSLARQLWDIGAKAAAVYEGTEFQSYENAGAYQQHAARAIAAFVLANFERKAAR